MEENINQEQQKPLEEKLQDIRTDWTNIIKSLAEKMKDLPDLQSLLNQIFVKRAELAEYIAALRVPLAKLNQKYKHSYAQKYQNYKMNSQLRYNSDSAINTQIEVELEEILGNIDLVKIHLQFMEETLATIDKMIFGIKERIDIYQLLNGIKF